MEKDYNAKVVIVVRKDLKMRRGKEIAQCSHAVEILMLQLIKGASGSIKENSDGSTTYSFTSNSEALKSYIMNRIVKITCSVDSEAELLKIYEEAKSANLPVSLVRDAGFTEFNGVPTYTAIAIGPAKNEELHPITGHLKLY